MSVIHFDFKNREYGNGRVYVRDRAAAVANAVMQIFRTASPDQLQEAIENYLRDEISDIERQVACERGCDDA